MKTLKPQEVFEYLHKDLKYIAMDSNLEWFAFKSKPIRDTVWNMHPNDNGYSNLSVNDTFTINIDYTGDWKDSLHSRYGSKLTPGEGISVADEGITVSLDPEILKRIEQLENQIKNHSALINEVTQVVDNFTFGVKSNFDIVYEELEKLKKCNTHSDTKDNTLEKKKENTTYVVPCECCGGHYLRSKLVHDKDNNLLCINCATRIDSKDVWLEVYRIRERIEHLEK